jgi:hypothetical protein
MTETEKWLNDLRLKELEKQIKEVEKEIKKKEKVKK